MPISCINSNPNSQQCLKLSHSKIEKLSCLGITLLVVAILFAVHHWHRGNFQVLMTAEGKVVLGLFLSGAILASISGALHAFSKCSGKKVIPPYSPPRDGPTVCATPADFENTSAKKYSLLTGVKSIKQLIPCTDYVVAVMEQASVNSVVCSIYDRKARMPYKQTFAGNPVGPFGVAFNQFFLTTSKGSNSSIIFYDLQSSKKTEIQDLQSSQVTALGTAENFRTSDDEIHARVCFIGYENGAVDIVDVNNQTFIANCTAPDKKPILSFAYTTGVSLKEKLYNSLLVFGTDEHIYFLNKFELTPRLETNNSANNNESAGTEHVNKDKIAAELSTNGTKITVTDNKTLISIDNFTVNMWEMHTLKEPYIINFFAKVVSLSYLECTSTLAFTGSGSGHILVWNLKEQRVIHTYNDFDDSKTNDSKKVQVLKVVEKTLFSFINQQVAQLEFIKDEPQTPGGSARNSPVSSRLTPDSRQGSDLA